MTRRAAAVEFPRFAAPAILEGIMTHGAQRFCVLLVLLLLVSTPLARADSTFVRGDVDQSGDADLSDPIAVLGYLFLGRTAPECMDSADANDDGELGLADAIYELSFLFLGGRALPAPYPACGIDPTGDALGCERFVAPRCPSGPSAVEARAPSNHYVLVSFDGPVTEELLDRERWEIIGPNDTRLPILDVTADPNDDHGIIVATESQATVEYRLNAAPAVQGPGGPIVFQGSDDAEPRVVTAISLGSTETEGKVLLTFSEPINEGATEARFYKISNPDLEIHSAEFSSIGVPATTVELTTDPQRNLFYTVKVTNVKGRAGDFLVDPTRNLVTFYGIPPVDTDKPQLLSAVPSTNTTVLLSFNEPLWPGGDDPRNFTISCQDPFNGLAACPDLEVTAAEMTMLDTQIILTTLSQTPGLEYTVTVHDRCGSFPERDNCVQDLQENPIDPNANTAVFIGRDREPPYLASAISLGPDPADPETKARVLLTFSEPVLEGSDDTSFYSIDDPDLDIFAAELSLDGLTVVLTTEAQRNTPYTVKVTNVRSRTGEYAIDPARSTATFVGIPPEDTTLPQVTGALSAGVSSIVVSFSEPLLPGADDPLNFEITCETLDGDPCPGLLVTGAELTSFNTQVVLATTPQTAYVEYTVTVLDRCEFPQESCVQDLQENPIDPAANSASFIFGGTPAYSDDLPRVVGAISTSNRTVIIQFSRPMSDSVLDRANYFIVQENVNPEVGALPLVDRCVGGMKDGDICTDTADCIDGLCEGPRFLGPTRLAVELKTLSQNEVTYAITAINVTDLSGSPIAPPTVGPGGVVIDPRTTSFPGTPPGQLDLTDSDGDGLTDNVEQRGWLVTIELTNGRTVEREVTSDPFDPDTDGDGLEDLTELQIGSDPRSADTDADELRDDIEYNVVYSNQNDQDSDDDGISDSAEVRFYRTNANIADSDGDGFSDDQELFELNRDPRIADLPEPEIDIGEIVLRIDERFTYTDESGETKTAESSTSTSFERTSSTELSRGAEQLNQGGFEIAGSFGLDGGGGSAAKEILVQPKVSAEFSRNFQVSVQSAQAASNAFESSVSKGEEITGSRSSTREVAGARIEAFVNLDNLSNVAFSISNLEVTISAPDPKDRSKLVPVATLVPNSTLVTGESATFHIGALDQGRGPILFASEQVFPRLVEDLLRDPRGLVLDIANYDVEDEFGRNFAFTSQMARDRTVGLLIDKGDGKVERYFIAAATIEKDDGDFVSGYGDYIGYGPRPAIPVGYLLEDVLLLPRSTLMTVPAAWSGLPAVDSRPPDAIRVGVNGVSESIARGDDLQLIPAGIDGLPDDAIVITAGENGVLDTTESGDDVPAVITGFSTSASCNGDTTISIKAGVNGTVETRRDEASDDVQAVAFPTSGHAAITDIILPGPNGFVDTAAQGDDVYVGPGIPCDDDTDCPGGACDGQEILYRFEDRERGKFGRFWAILISDDTQLGADFDELVLRPGEVINLGFVRDRDRDGLISRQEFLFGSSDERQDTDADGLDDFSEVKIGWEIQVAGSPIRRVFPDPRLADSDFDGLSDSEEQDFRRAQCECVNDTDSTVRSGPCPADLDCPTGSSCLNVADLDAGAGTPIACSTDVTENRTDPRLADTDGDGISDGDEVRGFQTGIAIVDPSEVITAGSNRAADSVACPDDVCIGGGINDGEPCRFDRDCGPIKECVGGASDGDECVSDIDCTGDPRNPGLCEVMDSSGVTCDHEPGTNGEVCDDVQVFAEDTTGLTPSTVIIAPGYDGELHSTTLASLSADDVHIASGTSDLAASSSALGDDEQVAPSGASLTDNFLGRVVVRPGFDGEFQTGPGGDDVVAYAQRLQTASPLEVDTDADLVPDGLEKLLGADPRNPADGRTPNDSDGDGLYDSVEQSTGWLVSANGETPRRVFSNPRVPDSDLDGVPDFAERQLGLDPNSDDTDGDGLSDFDELSERQFTELSRFNSLFPGFFIDGSTSEMIGTDPLDCDSDDDKLPDGFEALTGWSVRVVTSRGVEARRVFPDPLLADTDFDGLADGGEYLHNVSGSLALPTDPTSPDTDGDDRLDGTECSTVLGPSVAACAVPTAALADCGSDPLKDDLKVTVRYATIVITNGPQDGLNAAIDVSWELRVQKSTEGFPGSFVITANEDNCTGDYSSDCKECQVKEGVDIALSASTNSTGPFSIGPSQGFLVHGEVNESDNCNERSCQGGSDDGEPCDTVSDCSGGTSCEPEQELACHLTFFRSYSFEMLQPGFSTEVISLSDSTDDAECQFDVVVEILVE